ncbi:hypothetical protein [Bizionia sp.]|uniref:hypothetical protein n=1 Tax=Bizionia sp. TaxID=1954480 RepID=UPI003A945764
MKNNELLKIIESTAVSVASSFPVLASLATGWNEYKNHVQTRNVKNIMEVFYYKLNEIDHKISHQYLESDNLKALIVKTCFYGKEEISNEKRKMLSQFLVNSCTNEHYEDVTKNSILETIIKLSGFDVLILEMIVGDINKPQYLMLSGKEKYDPNIKSWSAMSEITVIKLAKQTNEKDVLLTLEYLISVGVIENSSQKAFNNDIDGYIRRFLEKKEYQDLLNKIKKLRKPNATPKESIELKNLEEQHQRYLEKKETEYNVTSNNEKHYVGTALGLSVLAYLKE